MFQQGLGEHERAWLVERNEPGDNAVSTVETQPLSLRCPLDLDHVVLGPRMAQHLYLAAVLVRPEIGNQRSRLFPGHPEFRECGRLFGSDLPVLHTDTRRIRPRKTRHVTHCPHCPHAANAHEMFVHHDAVVHRHSRIGEPFNVGRGTHAHHHCTRRHY